MKKHASLVVALLLAGVSSSTADTAQAAKPKAVQVFILAGQSNMQGVGNLVNTEPTSDVVHSFNMRDEWVIAEDPLHSQPDAADSVHWGQNDQGEPVRLTGAEADAYFHESALVAGGAVNDVIERLAQSALCGDDDGAKFLDLAGHGIAGRNQRFFFTRKSGLSLYTTRDVAYHLDKFDRCDMALNVLGEDHKLQSQLLALALTELDATAP